ncbi:hypothetical protein [Flindersiella endophytica]
MEPLEASCFSELLEYGRAERMCTSEFDCTAERLGDPGLLEESHEERLSVTHWYAVLVGVAPKSCSELLIVNLPSGERIPHNAGEVPAVDVPTREVCDGTDDRGDRKAIHHGPLQGADFGAVEADTRSAGLLAFGAGELEFVCIEVPKLVDRSCGSVGDDSGHVVAKALVGSTCGIEGKPRCPEIVKR